MKDYRIMGTIQGDVEFENLYRYVIETGKKINDIPFVTNIMKDDFLKSVCK